jgi:hypothetical protein
MTLQEGANIATIVGSLAVIGVIVQIALARRQMKADHERSRREKTVELLLEWTKSLKENTSLARRIVESLGEEQARNLFNEEETRVSSKYRRPLEKILDVKEKEIKEDKSYIVLSGEQVSKLRWIVMNYLNLLESTLVAWQYSIVDREIIEHQFSYLFAPEQGHAALKNFRIAAGGENAFPAIEIFSSHIEEKRRSVLIEKANIV